MDWHQRESTVVVEIVGTPTISQGQAAELLNVSRRGVQQAVNTLNGSVLL
jgi:hypothetical protein